MSIRHRPKKFAQERPSSALRHVAQDWVLALMMSPEKEAWVRARYPESDTGRPGILHYEDTYGRDNRARRRDPVVYERPTTTHRIDEKDFDDDE